MLYTQKAKSDNIFCIFDTSYEYFANKIISLLVINHPQWSSLNASKRNLLSKYGLDVDCSVIR